MSTVSFCLPCDLATPIHKIFLSRLLMNMMVSHPIRKYGILFGSHISETPPLKIEPPMDYQQANVESFEAATKAVADLLSASFIASVKGLYNLINRNQSNLTP